MDIRERVLEYAEQEGLEEIIRSAFAAQMRNVWTAIPVSLSEDSDGKTAKLKPGIKVPQRNAEGKTQYVELPELHEVPIQFASGGGMTATFPLKKSDEGLVIIASRDTGAWRQSGGQQQTTSLGSHSLSDAFFIPGIRSAPRDLKNINTEAAEWRTDDGKHKASVHPKNGLGISVEDGKHTMAWHPANGISAAVDNGAHTLSLSPQSGISMKSATSIAAEAGKGIAFKGPFAVDGKITSSQPIGGSVLAGVLGGGIGALMGMMITAALLASPMAQTPGSGFHTARYALASLWGQP